MITTNNSKVYIGNLYNNNLLEEIYNGLDFIEKDKIINKDSTIFIKPNLTDVVHKPGITTTPLMIKAVIEAFSPLVKKVYVGESDGGNYSFSATDSLKNHGVFDYANKFDNVEVVNLSNLPRTRVKKNVCGKDVWIDLPDLLLNDIDCLVSLPVFKSHAMTHGTFSIKNLWGCYPDPMRVLYHKNLDYKLALINKLTKNKIQIIDGFWALDGHGPMEGTPVETNKVLVSNDPVAGDYSAAYMMNLDIKKIGHIDVAEKFGLGTTKIENIKFNKNLAKERLAKFKPYKVKLDYFSMVLFRSEIISKCVLDSQITPLIYALINLTRPEKKKTNCAKDNLKNRSS